MVAWFVDLSDFSRITHEITEREEAGPELVGKLLNEVFGAVIEKVTAAPRGGPRGRRRFRAGHLGGRCRARRSPSGGARLQLRPGCRGSAARATDIRGVPWTFGSASGWEGECSCSSGA